ncbi:hypothetical protein ACFPAF_11275 [Hymenobacter endophyticus]|uniref:Uncharacterized protein n=1 Tax=Hymenobacter endophyticus TaxID=3076335 RepID=A0ABU3THZ6_9BACT|nr:hypothetical protein [Hymenobacter endophyticus]MDU0370977.1 hypothetical protein [Hymenobacter endophyticus]
MNGYPTTVSIAELEQILSRALESLKQQYGPQGHIPLTQDFYWDIPADQLYVVEEEPSELTIGQLSEDSQIVKDSHNGELLLGFDLLKASHLLRYISHTHPTLP